MAADKFDCPKCGTFSQVTATIVGKRETTRYRHCRVCSVSFVTAEALKDTPKMRKWLGEGKADELWPKPSFKYRNPAVPRAGKKWDKSKA